MSTLERRLEKVLEGLGPEETARLFIEGPPLGTEVPAAERRRLIDRMTQEEGQIFNRFLDRFEVLKDNLRSLLSMVADLHIKLLERDRLLWYWRGVEDLQEQLIFGDAAKPLLIENVNLKPGKPFTLRTLTGTVQLGVWGKHRSQFGPEMREMSPRIAEVLDSYAQGIRSMAAEVKAVERWVREEAQAIRMITVLEITEDAVAGVKGWDRPLLRELAHRDEQSSGGALLPVDTRWTLAWEDIEEDQETARRVRKDPEGWWPPSVDGLLQAGVGASTGGACRPKTSS